jgi:predicted nucleic acid-binding protein
MAVLQSRIVPFGEPEAALAARLFNDTGRRRGSRFDCLIAATAILAQAKIATLNASDFKVFASHGLRLVADPASPSTMPAAKGGN